MPLSRTIPTNTVEDYCADNHRNGKGARYTAARRPVRLVYVASFATRSEALKEELRIKGLTRSQKAKLIADVV